LPARSRGVLRRRLTDDVGNIESHCAVKQSVETVVDLTLPVAERLLIRRTRFSAEPGDELSLPRIAVVTGTHGDEVEGQLVCAWLASALREGRWDVKGIVDIYPALNPLGLDTITRNMPPADVDLNRTFDLDRNSHGSFLAPVTDGILDSLTGALAVVDVHASNIFLREIPQVRISQANAEMLRPLARWLNVEFLWIHEAATVLENTLAYSLNSRNTPTLVVEMGVGMRLTPAMAQDLVTGIGALATFLGILGPDRSHPAIRAPMESDKGAIHHVNAQAAGLFVPEIGHRMSIKEGQILGSILSAQTGETVARIESPADALVFTLREYPIVMEGSLIARLYEPSAIAEEE